MQSQTDDMVSIEGGEFTMGSTDFYPEERPVRRVRVDPFAIDRYPVTNADFAGFAGATGYLTVAERPIDPSEYPGAIAELCVPASLVFQPTAGAVDLRDLHQWWAWTPGASWKHPLGPDSTLDGLADHPVVHVALEDVQEYATWAGKALPSEAEWEFAARGGLHGAAYTWGDEMTPGGSQMANTWQGEFPWQNLLLDGYERTSPVVGTFPANGYGLYDMAGNVWEWTSDWYSLGLNAEPVKPCCAAAPPRVPGIEESYDPRVAARVPRKVVKGGSHLCAPSYCLRFRPAARSPQMVDSPMSHLGFRCVRREA